MINIRAWIQLTMDVGLIRKDFPLYDRLQGRSTWTRPARALGPGKVIDAMDQEHDMSIGHAVEGASRDSPPRSP